MSMRILSREYERADNAMDKICDQIEMKSGYLVSKHKFSIAELQVSLDDLEDRLQLFFEKSREQREYGNLTETEYSDLGLMLEFALRKLNRISRKVLRRKNTFWEKVYDTLVHFADMAISAIGILPAGLITGTKKIRQLSN